LLPLVLEDVIKIGFTRNHRYIQKFIKHVKALIQPLAFNKWHTIDERLTIKLKPAGHILGSAYVLCKLKGSIGNNSVGKPNPKRSCFLAI